MRIALTPMLLLGPLALISSLASAAETQRVAADASEIRVDFSRSLLGKRVATELATKPLDGEWIGFTAPVQSPYAMQTHGPDPLMAPHVQQGYRGLRGACENSASDLCYDLVARRIVYRPVRQYMPKFDGLTPENVSLHRTSIHFRYSFQ